MLNRRPSAATVIASIALFVSLGGVSYGVATGSIDSREIKNSTVRSKDIRNDDVRGRDIRTGTVRSSDVRNNDLTGADIVESTLGTVPSASNAGRANVATSAGSADTANSATTAANVNGVSVRGIRYRSDTSASPTPIFSSAGLTLTATCTAGLLAVTASTSRAAIIDSFSINAATTLIRNDVQNEAFTPAETQPLLPDGSNDEVGETRYVTAAGELVTIAWDAQDSASFGTSNVDCLFTGHAMIG